jgi:hypothetical protein
MVRNGIHLLEFCHVNIAESSSLPGWFGDFSACGTRSPEKPLSIIIFAVLLRSLYQHLCLDSSSLVPHILHQLLGLIAEGRLSCELELELRRGQILRKALARPGFCRTILDTRN